MNIRFILFSCICAGFLTFCHAQDISTRSWQNIAYQMPDEWYASDEAVDIASKVLDFQMENGGWSKNMPYNRKEADAKLKSLDKSGIGSTIDNNATTSEMIYLAKVYKHRPDEKYKDAIIRGVNYLLMAQYENGGWPQFYPVRKGRSVAYSGCITYNDNAMVNAMEFLRNIYEDNALFVPLELSSELKTKAKESFEKGVVCILNTQIKVHGELTVWCAQHDQKTLEPAKARAYELPSFSGDESAKIVTLLMSIKNPSPEIVQSVKSAVKWFQEHKIEGLKYERYRSESGEKMARLVPCNDCIMWARFYDLETGKPFFCDRDGIKRSSIDELGAERRGGYSWYTTAPARVLKNYPKWLKSIGELSE
jgi:pectinesterase